MLGQVALRYKCWLACLPLLMELRVESNPPCEPAHIFLTALARCARWTGYYERRLVAFSLAGSFFTMAGMATAMQGTRAISR